MKFIKNTYKLIAILFFAQDVLKANINVPLDNKPSGLQFIENKGQVRDQNQKERSDILFSGASGDLSFHLSKKGISYQLARIEEQKSEPSSDPRKEMEMLIARLSQPIDIYRLDIQWLNVNTESRIEKGKAITAFDNFYFGSTLSGIRNVKSYEDITYKNIYKGIDLHYYSKDGHLKYDYIVQPNTDYKQIQLQIEGATIKLLNNGDLLFTTPLGNIIEEKPVVYQNGIKLISNWVVKNNVISFSIKNYDPYKALLIDPGVRQWGTYYGGTSFDRVTGSMADKNGNVYIVGYTGSPTAIATSGVHQATLNGQDAFLVKFNTNGVRQWGTYFGGPNGESGMGCAIDGKGNMFISGISNGGGLATSGAHQTLYGGNNCDAFLVKFDSSGFRQWSTYYGGTGQDFGTKCATDKYGNIYLAGQTQSTVGTIMATTGSHQSTYGGGQYDAYLVQFNTNGVRQWATYYGTNGDEQGLCTTDTLGNVYFVGWADMNSSVFVTSGAYQATFAGGADAFIAKFNVNGVRQWGTYYGGVNLDFPRHCTIDLAGDLYFTGNTFGPGLSSPGSHQSIYGGGNDDAFLVKFNSNGVRQWATFYGGSASEQAYGCCSDINGDVYICGYTASSTAGTIIATPSSHQTSFGGNVTDGFIVRFNTNGVREWGSYYGGNGNSDFGNSCVADNNGNVFMSGFTTTNTGTNIASFGSHQPNVGSLSAEDGFLVKFKNCDMHMVITANTPICAGDSVKFNAVATGTTPLTYLWLGPNSFTSTTQNPSIANAQLINDGTYTLTTDDGAGCILNTETTITITPSTPTVSVNSGTICVGQTFAIIPSGASSYTFEGGNSVVSPTTSTTYTIIGSNACGTSGSFATCSLMVNPLPIVNASTSNSIICGPPFQGTATVTASGALTYSWNTTATGTAIAVSPSITTTYTVTGTDVNGCKSSAMLTQSVSSCTGINEQPIRTDLILYPNPTSGIVTIKAKAGLQIHIYNIIGKLILTTELKTDTIELDLSVQADGIYFIQIGSVTKKIIKG